MAEVKQRKPAAKEDSSNGASSNNNGSIGTVPVTTVTNDSFAQKTVSIVKEIFGGPEGSLFVPVLTVRLLATLGWTGGILYSTYCVYRACEDHLADWFKDPVMNPGTLSGLFNRGKDSTDYEWDMFTSFYASRLWIWYGTFMILCKTIQPAFPKQWQLISLSVSVVFFSEHVGVLPTLFMLSQPVVYWMIAKTKNVKLAWGVTVIFIYNLNTPFTTIFLPTNEMSEYFFVVTSAWNYARCISFCYDNWERGTEMSLKSLLNAMSYCFYLPLAESGPLVTYEKFEKNIINKDPAVFQSLNLSKDFIDVLKKLAKIGLIIFINEFILHFLYFRALGLTTSVHKRLNLWAICGCIYWLGQFFALKYKVLYGLPTVVAEFDGMEMPRLPACPSYIHRYSVLWRDFDNGLYRFLVKYIYVPSLSYLKSSDTSNRIPDDVQKLMASFLTYVYVYIWHSLSLDVFIWTALNFLGITIERIGSAIKREVDKRVKIEPIHWDFVIEPIVTTLLAGMSIWNSAIFCGSLATATSFGQILWERRSNNWVFIFLYCMCHVGVMHRTWRASRNAAKLKEK